MPGLSIGWSLLESFCLASSIEVVDCVVWLSVDRVVCLQSSCAEHRGYVLLVQVAT
jgi:hypothetical protein